VAISFVDAEITRQRRGGAQDVTALIDARHGLVAVIALLRGDVDADERVIAVGERRKHKKEEKQKEEKR